MREICGLQIIKGGHKAADDRLKSWASNAGVKTSRMNKCKERWSHVDWFIRSFVKIGLGGPKDKR